MNMENGARNNVLVNGNLFKIPVINSNKAQLKSLCRHFWFLVPIAYFQ